MSEWHRPAGSTGDAAYDVKIVPGQGRWRHTGLYAATLAPGESRVVGGDDCEWIVLPLAGGPVRVEVGAQVFELPGRPDVFAGPTDFAYIPQGQRFTVTADRSAAGDCRIALPCARVRSGRGGIPEARHVAATEVPIELRGAGSCSRQVHNFGIPAVLEADSIIACEVITPAGNWSSYPPHKHDEDRPGQETALEEIYYVEVRAVPPLGGPDGTAADGVGKLHSQVPFPATSAASHGKTAQSSGYSRVGEGDEDRAPRGLAYLRTYGTAERPIDTLVEVGSGDVVLVPHGWHGPAMAAPGYDLYYLNVMAGPGERAWLICDDPAHSWVRQTWAGEPVDPRLPFGPRSVRAE